MINIRFMLLLRQRRKMFLEQRHEVKTYTVLYGSSFSHDDGFTEIWRL